MDSFSLLTLNAFGTARGPVSFLRWRGIPDAERLLHPSLRALVGETDVACFQEIFLSEAEEFFEALPHPERHRDPNHTELWPLTFGGSGLAIASRLPRLEGLVQPYARPHTHAERFARKGMLHARLRLGEGADAPLVDVITTHLQAGQNVAARAVRRRQFAMLRAFVESVASPDRACIVCGDFNVDALAEHGDEYAALCAALAGFEDLGAGENAPTFAPRSELNALAHRFDSHEPVQRIDQIFFRPARDRAIRAERCTRIFDSPLDSARVPPLFASDHFGLRATFRVG